MLTEMHKNFVAFVRIKHVEQNCVTSYLRTMHLLSYPLLWGSD